MAGAGAAVLGLVDNQLNVVGRNMEIAEASEVAEGARGVPRPRVRGGRAHGCTPSTCTAYHAMYATRPDSAASPPLSSTSMTSGLRRIIARVTNAL